VVKQVNRTESGLRHQVSTLRLVLGFLSQAALGVLSVRGDPPLRTGLSSHTPYHCLVFRYICLGFAKLFAIPRVSLASENVLRQCSRPGLGCFAG
jgi:hypothetical protein